MFANSQMGGLDLGFPDVCLTPPVPAPIPYPNIALGPMSVPSQAKVFYFFTPAHNLLTVTPVTNGDNAGLATGVASGTVMGPSRRLLPSFTLLVGGMCATRLTSLGIQNNTNCPGVRIVPSQVRVLLCGP
jgi:hypothetical protein